MPHFIWSLNLYVSPNSDKNEISLYIIILYLFKHSSDDWIKKVITKDKMSWYLDTFALLVPYKIYGEQ